MNEDNNNYNEDELFNNEDIEDLYDNDNLEYNDVENNDYGKNEHERAKDENGHYDENYYQNRQKELDQKVSLAKEKKDTQYKMKKGSENEAVNADGSNTQNKNLFDRGKDYANYGKAKFDASKNKLDGIKDKAYKTMHPKEMLKEKASSKVNDLKDKTKEKAKEVSKKAVKKVGSSLRKAVLSLVTSPNGILIIGIIGIVTLIVFIVLLFFSGKSANESLGYYDSNCNFNETNVILTSCSNTYESSEEESPLSIKNYVIGVTYAYTNNNTFSDEQLKALIIIIKTNALSRGNYNSSEKTINLDDCDVNYIDEEEIKKEDFDKLSNLYDSVENYLYLSESYNTTISNLGSINILSFDQNIVNNIKNSKENSYDKILASIYSNNTVSNDDNTYRESLFLGDSRMQGMLLSGVINNNNTVYGVGYGYNWLTSSSSFDASKTNATSGAINGINGKMKSGVSYNIITWLGVNDYTYRSALDYFTKYQELAMGEWKNHIIYVVSVGPVSSSAVNVDNEGIDNFNNEMKNLINSSNISNLKYIDLNYTEESITNYDNSGLHYSNEDYKKIYNIILNAIDNNISKNLQLYNLNDYCVYYNLTENDLYWWPIGSSNATSGNIYGGEPSSVRITSGYGYREISGNYGFQSSGFHKGFDIGGSCNSTVVIASKGGVVVEAYDGGCVSNDNGNDNCGGGYGNHIKIDHGDGISTYYAHLYTGSFAVKEGDTVEQGQKIALVGSSGMSTGCHLHFEVRVNNSQVDPGDYVNAENPRPTNNFNFSNLSGSGEGGKQNVCRTLLSSNISKNAVIGILINLNRESGFRTNNLENCYEEGRCCTSSKGNKYGYCVHPELKGFGSDEAYTLGVDSGAYKREYFANDHAGYGLVQWTSAGRKANLYDYSKKINESIGSAKTQLGFMLEEELPTYSKVYKYITGNYSAYDIGLNYCLYYEAPSQRETGCPKRVSGSLDEFTAYVNNNCN